MKRERSQRSLHKTMRDFTWCSQQARKADCVLLAAIQSVNAHSILISGEQAHGFDGLQYRSAANAHARLHLLMKGMTKCGLVRSMHT